MKLYKSYCYPTLDDVALNIVSNPVNDFGIVSSATVVDQTIDINYSVKNQNYSIIVTPPDCSKLGFNNSYTGLSTADSLEISAGITLILVTAFCLKVLKRPL